MGGGGGFCQTAKNAGMDCANVPDSDRSQNSGFLGSGMKLPGSRMSVLCFCLAWTVHNTENPKLEFCFIALCHKVQLWLFS